MNEIHKKVTEQTVEFRGSEIVEEILGKYFYPAVSGTVPVVIFCAGASGNILAPLFSRYGIKPACFCDNDSSRAGNLYCDLPIISFDELKNKHRESLIVIASAAYQKFIKTQLLENSFNEDKIIVLDAEDSSFDSILRRERIMMLARNGEPTSLLDDLCHDEEKLLNAYELLTDNKSKDIFIRRLALVASSFEYKSYKNYLSEFSEPILKMGYNNPERFKYDGNYFYFNNDVLNLQDGETFIDGGAFVGDSAEEFIKHCKNNNIEFRQIHCFEPDKANFKELTVNMAKYKNIVCRQAGLWSHSTTLRFVSSAQTDRYCARIQGDEIGAQSSADIEINTVGIDEHLNGAEVSLIKMDIEGAELEALKGAAESIKDFAPKLAISVYHNVSDLYEIPLMIHQIRPDYKLYLRHLGNYFDDTILFAQID